MANLFYGKNRGQHEEDVVEASSTSSTDIEVRIDTGKYNGVGKGSKEEAIRDVEMILRRILRDFENLWG